MKVFLSKNFKTESDQIYLRLHRDLSAIYYINGVDVTSHIEANYDFAHFVNISCKKDILFVKEKLKKKVIVNYFIDKHTAKKDNVSEILIPNDEKKLLNKCDLIIASCQADKMILIANEIKTPIEVVTPPVKEEKFSRISGLEKNSFFKYAGLMKNDSFALSMVNYKNIQDVQDLIVLANELKTYKIFVFGPRLKLFRNLKIKKQIRKAPKNIYFKTYINEDLFKSALLLSNFFIVTRESEGEIITILEAMITKTQIMTYHSHFIGDVLNDNVNCIHVTDSKELANKIKQCEEFGFPTIEEGYSFAKKSNYETCGQNLKQILEKYIELDFSQE